MSSIFEVRAYDKRRVRLTQVQLLHMVFFHPEVENEQAKIRKALENPEIVVEGATKDTKICYRLFKRTPVTSKYLAVVVKVLNQEGFIVTAYFTERVRRGKVLWKKTK
jgi:hypothetical protein